MTTYHTTECLAWQNEVKAAVETWEQQWPNYCKNCNGTGEFIHLDNEAGWFSEACSACTEWGKCPRCGKVGLTSEDRGDSTTGDGPCTFCNWNYTADRPIRYDDWCDCEEQRYRAIEETQ